jgi:hypothetical protein
MINGRLESVRHGQKGQLSRGHRGRVAWHDACKTEGVNSLHPPSSPYSYGTELGTAVDASYTEQTRRRAARWHAWLKSPECTLQDRENFERWCTEPMNAAAYVALCGGLAWAPELASDFEDDGVCGPGLALQSSPPLVINR